jgi:helicase-like protein
MEADLGGAPSPPEGGEAMSRRRKKEPRPDTAPALAGLKDFQLATVEHVFSRMYLDEDPTRRFLIADEVGLGKTLVARGVIARMIDSRWDDVDRINVVYICSNHDIARQNINRLRPGEESASTLVSRITLLPTRIHGLRERKLNFVSFTPGTSFDLRSSLGTMEERRLLYWLLKEPWDLRGKAPLNLLQGHVGDHNHFREYVRRFHQENSLDRDLARAYVRQLKRAKKSAKAAGKKDLRSRFEELSHSFKRPRLLGRVPAGLRAEHRALVGELRSLLASSCIEALKPDLVILDEFQRFKKLLVGEDEASLLARQLFDYSDDSTQVRVLMLSATPYKMYTLADEGAEDSHYEDFIDTLRFLYGGSSVCERVAELLQAYGRQLCRLGGSGPERLHGYKVEIERHLRHVMVRTERLAASADRSGMLKEVKVEGVAMDSKEVGAYLTLQDLARYVGHGETMPYWKSAPYLLSYMEDYQLKRKFKEFGQIPSHAAPIAALLAGRDGLSLPWSTIRAYGEVDPANARLRAARDDVIEPGLWRLLWIPPALTYYEPGGAFADSSVNDFTKRLVFSAWRVVPKVVATFLSYEAERRAFRSVQRRPRNTVEARRRRRPLLRFARTNERLTGMPVLGLIYPCQALSRWCDPISIARRLRFEGRKATRPRVISEARKRIAPHLKELLKGTPRSGPEDDAWYWAAPILLDLSVDEESTRAWFRRGHLASAWAGAASTDAGLGERWSDHVRRAKSLVDGAWDLGRPPRDLERFLAELGLSGLGVCAHRALSRIARSELGPGRLGGIDAAATVGWTSLSLFNQPEPTAVIRGLNPKEPYWRRVLEYCLDGNYQAVLDEYAHVLLESLGFVGRPDLRAVQAVAAAMGEALTLRTVNLGADEISVDGDAGSIEINSERGLRGHFALRFGDESGDEMKAGARASQVRGAFNSPFWPFVLATTSVGQEGLDFHTYCHAVVHWNLPANPVDLEQREGRVHRYKGHAVRKNVSKEHWDDLLAGEASAPASDAADRSECEPELESDPWTFLFAAGAASRDPDQTDLVPFWIYDVEGGAKIERHVPSLPLSRDRARLVALRRSLVVYRMVFGQPRQEDLVQYLLEHLGSDEIDELLEEFRIDLSPPMSVLGAEDNP